MAGSYDCDIGKLNSSVPTFPNLLKRLRRSTLTVEHVRHIVERNFLMCVTETMLLFTAADRIFSLPLFFVEEILPAVSLLSVPSTNPAMEGLLDVRGALVPVLNMRALIKTDTRPMSYTDHVILLRVEDTLLAIRIDRAIELAALQETQKRSGGATSLISPMISHVTKLNDNFVISLDPQLILQEMKQWNSVEALASQ